MNEDYTPPAKKRRLRAPADKKVKLNKRKKKVEAVAEENGAAKPAEDEDEMVQLAFTAIKEALRMIPREDQDKALGDVLDTLDAYVPSAAGVLAAAAEKRRPHIYDELQQLQQSPLVPNFTEFECAVCMCHQEVGHGVVLKDCLHTFCRECLVRLVETSDEVDVRCPYIDAQDNFYCQNILTQNEIKGIVPEDLFLKYLSRGLSLFEHGNPNAFHCRTADCTGWCIIDDDDNEIIQFRCPVCDKSNCLACKAVHEGMSCDRFKQLSHVDGADTLNLIGNMLDSREAMPCPTCKVVVMKVDGCDAVQCSMCKTHICWATRGPRWGPKGVGDRTGGCHCGETGRLCVPNCANCH